MLRDAAEADQAYPRGFGGDRDVSSGLVVIKLSPRSFLSPEVAFWILFCFISFFAAFNLRWTSVNLHPFKDRERRGPCRAFSMCHCGG